MKQHSEIGYRILSSSPFLRDAAEMVYAHQEHYDGSGYPRGLAGADICIGARIFAIVDAYDAMRSERVYRGAVSPEQAAEEIRKNSGTQFDPDAVQAFLKCQIEIERLLQISRGKDEAPASGAQGR
jgi:HD-GYP domain-containing protein (c-di-GMP phosphodiesterase class II)